MTRFGGFGFAVWNGSMLLAAMAVAAVLPAGDSAFLHRAWAPHDPNPASMIPLPGIVTERDRYDDLIGTGRLGPGLYAWARLRAGPSLQAALRVDSLTDDLRLGCLESVAAVSAADLGPFAAGRALCAWRADVRTRIASLSGTFEGRYLQWRREWMSRVDTILLGAASDSAGYPMSLQSAIELAGRVEAGLDRLVDRVRTRFRQRIRHISESALVDVQLRLTENGDCAAGREPGGVDVTGHVTGEGRLPAQLPRSETGTPSGAPSAGLDSDLQETYRPGSAQDATLVHVTCPLVDNDTDTAGPHITPAVDGRISDSARIRVSDSVGRYVSGVVEGRDPATMCSAKPASVSVTDLAEGDSVTDPVNVSMSPSKDTIASTESPGPTSPLGTSLNSVREGDPLDISAEGVLSESAPEPNDDGRVHVTLPVTTSFSNHAEPGLRSCIAGTGPSPDRITTEADGPRRSKRHKFRGKRPESAAIDTELPSGGSPKCNDAAGSPQCNDAAAPTPSNISMPDPFGTDHIPPGAAAVDYSTSAADDRLPHIPPPVVLRHAIPLRPMPLLASVPDHDPDALFDFQQDLLVRRLTNEIADFSSLLTAVKLGLMSAAGLEPAESAGALDAARNSIKLAVRVYLASDADYFMATVSKILQQQQPSGGFASALVLFDRCLAQNRRRLDLAMETARALLPYAIHNAIAQASAISAASEGRESTTAAVTADMPSTAMTTATVEELTVSWTAIHERNIRKMGDHFRAAVTLLKNDDDTIDLDPTPLSGEQDFRLALDPADRNLLQAVDAITLHDREALFSVIQRQLSPLLSRTLLRQSRRRSASTVKAIEAAFSQVIQQIPQTINMCGVAGASLHEDLLHQLGQFEQRPDFDRNLSIRSRDVIVFSMAVDVFIGAQLHAADRWRRALDQVCDHVVAQFILPSAIRTRVLRAPLLWWLQSGRRFVAGLCRRSQAAGQGLREIIAESPSSRLGRGARP